MSVDEKAYWLALSTVRGVGAVRFRKLLSFFGKISTAWLAPRADLIAAGMTERMADAVIAARPLVVVEEIEAELARKNVGALTWNDAAYPRYLQQIDQPPPVLYYRGTITPQDDLAVAIVGTRRVTAYGKQLTRDTAAYLVGNGVSIVSGLARGVDAIAHQVALELGGRTIAVLGSGVDIIYPPEHTKLATEITQSGAIISDYPLGTKPDAINFPPRNRIISGLARATIVIEAGEKSGALITAKFSADQGREVFAVPGSVLSPMSKGCNNLLAAGAIPMTHPSVVLENLNIAHQAAAKREAQPVYEPEEARILKALGQDCVHIDDLCVQLDASIEKLTAELTMMELKGLISRVGGMEYESVKRWD